MYEPMEGQTHSCAVSSQMGMFGADCGLHTIKHIGPHTNTHKCIETGTISYQYHVPFNYTEFETFRHSWVTVSLGTSLFTALVSVLGNRA